MSSKNNIKEATYIKGIAILLVFVGHAATPSFLIRPSSYEFIVQFIYSFHMPVFFLVSGFLSIKILNMNLKKDYIPFVKNKLYRLGIPFITISIITNLLVVFYLKLINQTVDSRVLINMIKNIILFPENGIMGALWFLYTLLAVSIISPLIIKLPLKLTLVLTLALNLFMPKDIYFLSISRISFFLIYFFIGLSFRKYYSNNINISNFKRVSISFICIVIISYYSFIITNQISVNTYIMNVFIFVCGILGMILILMFVDKFKNKKICNLLECLGNYSIDIYIFSWFFQIASMILISKILKIDNYSIFFISNLIIGSLSLPFSIYIIRKNNILRLIFYGIKTDKI